MRLAREDLWYVVEAELPDEENHTEQWKKDDRKAKATIVLLLENSQLSLVKNCVFAQDTYRALKNYHQKQSRSVRVSLLKKLCASNITENGDVEHHLHDFDDLFDRLDAGGTTLDKDTKICTLLQNFHWNSSENSLRNSFRKSVRNCFGKSFKDFSGNLFRKFFEYLLLHWHYIPVKHCRFAS